LPLADRPNELFIIDWEFAQFGHRSCDLGQIVGDLYERKIYSNLDIAISTMEGVIAGYGALSDEMAFRTAIYVGVHLISWYNRRPRKGPRVATTEEIVAGLTVGRDFMVKGWERDSKFFLGSALASLFAAR
jgi:aminoglycoside phosphotransferase (APT) family kinase protein